MPNGDSKIICPVGDEGVEREEVAPNMRTAAVQDGDVRQWPAEALEHLCSGPLNMRRAPVITLSRSMSVLFGYSVKFPCTVDRGLVWKIGRCRTIIYYSCYVYLDAQVILLCPVRNGLYSSSSMTLI